MPSIRIKRLHHVNLGISDIERAKDFYCGFLGLDEAPRPELTSPGIWLRAGRSQIHLSLRKKGAKEISDDHVAFVVEDMERAKRALKDRKIEYEELINERLGMEQVFFRDPDGNRIELAYYKGSWRPGKPIPKH